MKFLYSILVDCHVWLGRKFFQDIIAETNQPENLNMLLNADDRESLFMKLTKFYELHHNVEEEKDDPMI